MFLNLVLYITKALCALAFFLIHQMAAKTGKKEFCFYNVGFRSYFHVTRERKKGFLEYKKFPFIQNQPQHLQKTLIWCHFCCLRAQYSTMCDLVQTFALTCFDNFGRVLQSFAERTGCATGFTRQYGGLFIKN